MKTLTCTVLLMLSAVSFSFGEAASEKTTAIKEMFQVMGIDKQMTGGFEAMLPLVDQIATQLQLNSEEKEQLKNIYRDWFENDLDRQGITEKMIKLYAEAFTLEEIYVLSDFYETPVGRKFLQKSPELMKDGAQIGMEEAQSKQAKLMERLQPFLEKHQK